jgi:thiopeptide-type bacteriocin biosynthesis protein
MPAPARLEPDSDHPHAPAHDTAPTPTEQAVWRILAGTPLDEVAHAAGMPTTVLARAVDRYRRAGRGALDDLAAGGAWSQYYIEFTHWHDAEQAAARHVLPALRDIDGWWFIRKYPCWRLRVPGTDDDPHLVAALDTLTDDGVLRRWRPGIYEPETAAFGGDQAMTHAHTLFGADSRAILDQATDSQPLGRRELFLLLCTTLMRGAGLESYEQGDVWTRVAHERPLPIDTPAGRLENMAGDLRRLLAADTTPQGPLFGADATLSGAAPWADAFRLLGTHLGAASRSGALERGLRDVLSYHVLFHANRLGLDARTQGILAHAARTAVLGTHPTPPTTAPAPVRSATPRPGDNPTARFPLVLRARRAALDLATRMQEIRHFADTCHEPTDPEQRIDRACSTWNLAALTAADCAMPDLAADLCRRQFRILHAAWPLAGRVAIAGLQPLVNLIRLAARAGDFTAAHHALTALEHAVHHGGAVQLDGITVDFDTFTTTDADRTRVGPWLRTTLLEDGTRALAATGDWAKAATHAARYDDAFHELREGRQTRILADLAHGRTDAALALLNATTTARPWDHAVAACLRHHAVPTTPVQATHAAIQEALLPTEPATIGFRIRLGLTALDLTATTQSPQTRALCVHLIDAALASRDAFAARDVLHHPGCRDHTNPHQTEALARMIRRAGLGLRKMPQEAREHLETATRAAEAVLASSLSTATTAT